jgi:subtilase family serine protease
VEGKTVVAAAGDQGSEDCFGMKLGSAGRALAVDDPASQWYVTGVGGTTLGSIAPPSESAWRDGGGGVSTLWSMPSYQSGTSPALGVVGPSASCPTASGNCREVPDVSANAGAAESFFCGGGAEPCSPSGWAGYGGTSLSAPTWAALFALANASAACSGARVGFANPSLYAVAAGPGYTQAFNDITAGENDALGAHGGQYSASAGYDLATGLGTPIAGSGAVGDPGLIGQLCQAARPSSFPRAVAAGVGTSEPGLLLPPRITKLLPTSGTVRGGTQVTIRGARFTHVRSVMFGTRRAKSFRVLSASSIVAVDPGAQAGLVRVEVTTATGTTSRAVAARFTYAAMPVVSSVAPASGSSRGGSVATISGSSLTGVTSVRFGAVAAAMVRTSAVRVTVVVPAGRGTVDVTVTTPGGTSRTGPFDRFRYVS